MQGSNGKCLGNSTEVEDCVSAECPGIPMGTITYYKLSNLIIWQPFPLNGNPGGNGPIVRHLVGMGPEFGAVVAVNQLLGAMINVPGIQRRLRTVYQLSVQVFQWVP